MFHIASQIKAYNLWGNSHSGFEWFKIRRKNVITTIFIRKDKYLEYDVTKILGPVGLVLANCANMAARYIFYWHTYMQG